jgi:hypothetical protein
VCFMQYVHFSNRMILGSLGRVVRGPDVYVSPGVGAIIMLEELSDMCKVYGVLRLVNEKVNEEVKESVNEGVSEGTNDRLIYRSEIIRSQCLN